MRFDKNPFTFQSETDNKKAEGFQILHFYWSFLSAITAVKGLNKSSSLFSVSQLWVFWLKANQQRDNSYGWGTH